MDQLYQSKQPIYLNSFLKSRKYIQLDHNTFHVIIHVWNNWTGQ